MTLTNLLKRLGQEQLLNQISQLSKEKQDSLIQQLNSIDPAILRIQQGLLTSEPPVASFSPFQEVCQVDTRHTEMGLELLKAGKVGCIMVAGGQGTRLGFDGPKGAYPITPVKQKTLFQYFQEKVDAAGKQVGRSLPVAIMTSPLNDAETKSHFHLNNLSFFTQGMLPFLDVQGNLIFESPGKLAFGPDGNGSAINSFFNAGIADRWEKEGVELIIFVMVDNPLADPFDSQLIGSHYHAQTDISIKCIERKNIDEKVGLLVQASGQAAVVEYSEISPAAWHAVDSQGKLIYHLANISLFCFSFSFLKKIAKQPLRLHKAYKKLGDNSLSAWKFERFIFDLLPLASSSQALLYDRANCFAPVKDVESVKATQKALTHLDRVTLASITGHLPPYTCQEIDPSFYYPTPALLEKWEK